MGFARFSIKQRVPVNLAVIIVVLAGIYLFNTIPRETFPLISIKMVQIITTDPNITSPIDVEDLITVPIEEEIEDIDGIDYIRSVSLEGMSHIFVRAREEVDNIDNLINDIRQKVDIVKKELPGTTESPVIEELKLSIPLITVGISGKLDLFQIKKYIDELEDDVKSIKGVKDVMIAGIEDREIWVEIDLARLNSYGLSIDDVSRAISRKNLNLSAGTLKTTRGEFQIRGLGEIKTPSEIMDVIVKKHPDGRLVKISDFATVVDRFEESKTLSRVNGEPAITLTVLKTEEADSISISKGIGKLVKEYKKLLPEGLDIFLFNDTSKYIANRINTMENSAVLGLILVTIMLIIFMNWRIALLTAMGIPVAMCGAIVLMWLTGNTINLMTMFGMIMSLGMIVDDSIVVVENVYRYMERGLSPVEAAIKGSNEVIWPVIGSVSTTVAAFSPLLFMAGDLGKFMAFIPLTVIFALIASLFEAFFVLPSHLADFIKKPKAHKENVFLKKIITVYVYVLKLCLRRRYLFVVICILALVFTVWYSKQTARFVLFDTSSYIDEVFVRVTCPERNTIEDTAEVVKSIEKRIMEELPPSEYHTIDTTIGRALDKDWESFKIGSNLALIRIDITEENPKTRHGKIIINALIDILQDLPGATSIEVANQGGGPPKGSAVELEISGKDVNKMVEVVSEIKEYLSTIPGIQNLSDDFEAGKEEYRINIDEAKANLFGLDNTDINRAIRNAFAGLKSTEIRLGGEDVDVIVKAVDRSRKLREDIESLEIRLNNGRTVRLKTVATVEKSPGYNKIYRKDGKRIIKVTSDVDEDIITSVLVNKMVSEKFKDLSFRYPGVKMYRGGESEKTRESMHSLGIAFLIAFLCIYMIIGAIFHSFIQPLIVVLIIPFSVIGVLIGTVVTGAYIGLMCILGTVALSGIVVNDSIVMVDFINRQRRSGRGRWISMLRAGSLRFRPIMLTSITTIIGLLPLIFSGGQSQILAPMAVAVSWGLGFGTILTLLLIPSLLAIVDDIKLFFIGSWKIKEEDI